MIDTHGDVNGGLNDTKRNVKKCPYKAFEPIWRVKNDTPQQRHHHIPLRRGSVTQDPDR